VDDTLVMRIQQKLKDNNDKKKKIKGWSNRTPNQQQVKSVDITFDEH